MSEAELFVLRARLQGGILNKARRGALKLTLPIGLCYTESDTIVLDPNVQVQATIRRSFAALSTPDQLLRPFATFASNTCSFHGGCGAGRIKEKSPGERSSTMMCCGCCTTQPMQEPMSLGAPARRRPSMARFILQDRASLRMVRACEAMLMSATLRWEDYERNEAQLALNSQAYAPQRFSPPREGPALLQGLLICGRVENA